MVQLKTANPDGCGIAIPCAALNLIDIEQEIRFVEWNEVYVPFPNYVLRFNARQLTFLQPLLVPNKTSSFKLSPALISGLGHSEKNAKLPNQSLTVD